MTELATNVLFDGDNLDTLRRYLPGVSADLIYLATPFNSNRDFIFTTRATGRIPSSSASRTRGTGGQALKQERLRDAC